MEIGQRQELFLASLLLALGTGIIAGRIWELSAGVMVVPLLTAVGMSFYGALRLRKWTWLAAVSAFFLLGILRFAAADELPVSDISYFAGETVKVEGVLKEEPRLTQDEQGGQKQRYLLAVTQVSIARQQVQKASGSLYVYARQVNAPEVQIGDRRSVSGKVRIPRGYQNPGQLNTQMLLKSQGITATLSAGKQGIGVEHVDGSNFTRRLAAVRRHYREQMEKVMPKTEAAAIFAMLFGGYDGLSPALVESFTLVGLVHILSVSGSHISLLAAVMAGLGGLLRLPKAVTAVLVTGLIFIYSLLAGAVPPVIRSAIMGSLAFAALALDRERDARRILLLTGLAMLLISPLLLFHISFQLSFMATAGLLYLAPIWQKYFLEHGCRQFAAAGLSITLAAQLAALPILAWYFNQLSLASLVANIVVLPLVELLIVLGLFAGVLAFVFPLAGGIFFAGGSLLLGIVTELTVKIAALPASSVWIPSLNAGWSLLYYAVLSLFLLTREQRECMQKFLQARKKQLGIGMLAILVFIVSWQMVRPGELQVHFIDVGQGDAALVITPHGRAFMFDCGGTRDRNFAVGAKVDVPYLLHFGVRHLDAVFLSHAHEDHAAGCGDIMKKIPVDQVITADEGLADYARSMGWGDNETLLRKFHTARQGEKMTVDGVTVEVLFAPPLQAGDNKTGNEASNVYRVSYGQASFLFTGDLTKDKESQLLAEGINPASTVLKVGHHGSDTSSSEEFLQAAAPQFAVICVGADNSFGHPKKSVLARLQARGIQILRTDKQGAVKFCTDGRKMRVETYTEKGI